MSALPKPDDVFHAHHLKEIKVFIHTRSDAVLLRVSTPQPDETWYTLHRSDFIELANYLAKDAARMMARNWN